MIVLYLIANSKLLATKLRYHARTLGNVLVFLLTQLYYHRNHVCEHVRRTLCYCVNRLNSRLDVRVVFRAFSCVPFCA